ncbi:hypothetical protein F3Y22_tig00111310pilonHSYRG00055 [Hibiscus syriacus]|uniref:NAB domain-containing protein n=1 Tax=Hibiscus syriacus TaxID=106335 RepID=A0A6A2YQY4_HIBSY|nr:hypothetical protein F3Y22_tig00111310pilonHSYRG00055 [Hibiscus syriacus]
MATVKRTFQGNVLMVVEQPHKPENSKWLQENLTDMDSKVKQMIKLIEEDADSFARRAEMYYKKRPELIVPWQKCSEPSSHGICRRHTGVSATDVDTPTAEIRPLVRAFLEPDELQKDAVGISSLSTKRIAAITEESDPPMVRKSSKHFFHDVEEKERVRKTARILTSGFESHLSPNESEREANLAQYQLCLEKINNLQNSISHAQKDAGELSERASKSETEAQALKEDLARVEAEKEDALSRYKQCSAALQYSSAWRQLQSWKKRLKCAEEEAQKLKSELDDGAAKLKGAEVGVVCWREPIRVCIPRWSLWCRRWEIKARIKRETEGVGETLDLHTRRRMRFMEAETAFQTLQHLHSQSQEELRSLAMELQNRTQILQDFELDENTELKDVCGKERDEKLTLLEKLKIMEKLLRRMPFWRIHSQI